MYKIVFSSRINLEKSGKLIKFNKNDDVES